MTRLRITFALFLLLAAASASAQSLSVATNNARTNAFILSGGPAFSSDRIDITHVRADSTKTGYGGYVAADYLLTRGLSLRSEFSVTTMGGETNVITTVLDHGTPRTLSLHIPSRTAFHFDVGAHYYPLQFTDCRNFCLQPFVKAALGGMFYVTPSSSADIDPCPFISAGGGADIAFNARWSGAVEIDYYSSISDATLHTQGLRFATSNDGLLATVGVQYRF